MRTYRRLEVAFRQACTSAFGLDEVPDPKRQGVHVRVDRSSIQETEQLIDQFTARAMDTDLPAERPQTGTIGHDDVKPRTVAGFCHLPDAGDNSEAGEQQRHSVSEFPA